MKKIRCLNLPLSKGLILEWSQASSHHYTTNQPRKKERKKEEEDREAKLLKHSFHVLGWEMAEVIGKANMNYRNQIRWLLNQPDGWRKSWDTILCLIIKQYKQNYIKIACKTSPTIVSQSIHHDENLVFKFTTV